MLVATAASMSYVPTISMAGRRPRQKVRTKTRPEKVSSSSASSSSSVAGFGGGKTEPVWRCVDGCGACCKLDKGPDFASPEEIFENPKDVEVSITHEKIDNLLSPGLRISSSTEACFSVISQQYSCTDRPYFCRVTPENFQSLYGIGKKNFNREACASCRDSIKAIYGSNAEELENFNLSIKSSTLASPVEFHKPA
ncbi:hypothetical protein SAY86_021293 [Trapa natans]|uniref:Uncharacterized protein n=1 Tax=Trapa natans TaxID=22666 RepID=A0AAN7RJY9_TRANT|nr:hypothetical protein SAY86_021293 [Trapa natans]